LTLVAQPRGSEACVADDGVLELRV
jgi:hypothetical protein